MHAKIDGCIGYCTLRRADGDRVSNAEVRVRTGQEIAENTVRKRRIKWYGHISRMNIKEVAINSS